MTAKETGKKVSEVVIEPMPANVTLAYIAMIVTTASACVLPIPVPVHMMIMAMGAIYIGSYNSILQEIKEESETMESKDVYWFPIMGSAALFSLYLIFKFLPKEYVNMAIKVYFFVIGVLVLGSKIGGVIGQLLAKDTAIALKSKKYTLKMPEIPFEIPFLTGPKKEEAKDDTEDDAKDAKKDEGETITVTNLDLVGCIFSFAVGVAWVMTAHWTTSNAFGVAFSIQGIELLNLGSYFNGMVLLTGLFFYDIFWVFGTEVMVTVAKNFDAPIKLLFPQPYINEDPLKNRPSLLGLGDIVIPGIFIAMMLRFDMAQQKKTGSTVVPTYFRAVMIAYFLGLGTTVAVMYGFNAAQPALLYLVPACLLSTLGLGAVRGELPALLKYSEEEEKEEKDIKAD